MASGYPSNLPNAYAVSHYTKATTWDSGPIGPIMRAFWPVLFTGIGVEAGYGFAVNGGPEENTATAVNHAPFSEISLFGITAGRYDLLTPNRDTSQSNDWLRYHASDEVMGLLHRVACMEPECWRGSRGGLADAIAVGIVSLAHDGLDLVARLPIELCPSKVGLWFTALAFMAWSAGPTGALNHLRPYFARLAALPEPVRFAAWGHMLALDGYGRSTGAALSHSNPAHTWIRTANKLRTALLLGWAWRDQGTNLPQWACSILPSPQGQEWVDRVLALRAAGLAPADHGVPAPVGGWWDAANYGMLTLSLSP